MPFISRGNEYSGLILQQISPSILMDSRDQRSLLVLHISSVTQTKCSSHQESANYRHLISQYVSYPFQTLKGMYTWYEVRAGSTQQGPSITVQVKSYPGQCTAPLLTLLFFIMNLVNFSMLVYLIPSLSISALRHLSGPIIVLFDLKATIQVLIKALRPANFYFSTV